MKTVDDYAWDIVRREGGLVDDLFDRGGITNHGVSLKYAKGRGLDLDNDGDTDADDIRLVTPEDAVALYKADFFFGPKYDRLPEAVQPFLFDFAVNAYHARATMTLQRVCNEVKRAAPELAFAPLKEDGLNGRKTIHACETAMAATGEAVFVNAMVEERIRFYEAICENDPTQRRFLRGWTARANEFRVKEAA